jgi:outer membrane lipoprotein-sorting protein
MQVSSTMRSVAVLASTICAWAMVCAGQTNLNIGQIVDRIQQARTVEHDRSIAYTVTREYQLQAKGAPQANSQVVAQVSFVPPTAKEYTIVKSEGSDRGTGIVRKVLDHEVTMATHADANEVSPANYDFTLIGHDIIDGHDCYLLGITPKREAVELVRGRAWVDAKTFAIRRIQGQTAKNPSFWIKNLNVTLNYAEVKGVWVQTSTQAVADVRIAGPHVLSSRELDVQRATVSARSQTPSKVRPQRSTGHRAVADAATWVAR